jgi:hypothetical protein
MVMLSGGIEIEPSPGFAKLSALAATFLLMPYSLHTAIYEREASKVALRITYDATFFYNGW